MKRTDIAYAAGIIDGEGSISLCRRKQGGTRTDFLYSLNIEVVNTNQGLVKWLAEMYGGSVTSRERDGNRQAIFEWRICGKSAEPVLKSVLPFLKVKDKQARIAIEFIKTLSLPGTRVHRVPQSVHRHREQLCAQIRIFNARGKGA